jgi:hypothetical protein
MAKTNKWKLLPGIISRALIDPLVVVTAMTTLGSIVAILALVGNNPSKKIIVLCIAIALIGLLTVFYQVRSYTASTKLGYSSVNC